MLGWTEKEEDHIPSIPGTVVKPESDLVGKDGSKVLKDLININPLLVGQTEYDNLRLIATVGKNHPDVFYSIGRRKEPVGKFGAIYHVGVSPVIVNKDLFIGHEAIIPYTVVRAQAEIRIILTDLGRFTVQIGSIEDDRFSTVSVPAMRESLEIAQREGHLNEYAEFFRKLFTGNNFETRVINEAERIKLSDANITSPLSKK